jgi:undecaprenyl-diphosphatase
MFELLKNFNEFWLNNLNSLTQYSIIKNIALIFADAPIFFIPMFLLGFWILHNKKWETDKKENLLYIFYSVVLAVSINIFIQQFVNLERPETHLQNAGQLLLNHIPDASFPSDHAAVAASFLSAMFLFGYKKSAFTILPFFIIMLLSRIIAWVHWPLDIIVWSIVWIFSSFIIFKNTDFYIFKNINKVFLKIASFIKL